jgi:3-oxoacyl-[acyl-carrier protein] reductase
VRPVSVTDRAALVIGATAVGTAIARQLLRAGARVAVADSAVNLPDPVRAAAAHDSHAFTGTLLAGDPDSPANAAALVAGTVAALGGLDILVTAFDVAEDDGLLSMTTGAWDRVVSANLTRTFLICQAAANHMVPRACGRIVNVTARDWLGWQRRANYAASKAGVIGLTRTIAWELVGNGITANVVAPGWIEGERTAAMEPEAIQAAVQTQPIARLGSADDVASAVLFLVADEASYLTGQTLYVDGGRSVLSSLTA